MMTDNQSNAPVDGRTTGLSRAALLARLAKFGPRAIDVLAAASNKGDVNAAKAILSKLVPDLKAVDISSLEANQSRIVIAPRIFVRADGKGGTVRLPDININVDTTKALEPVNVQEIDISDRLKASPPMTEAIPQQNYREQRKKGKFA